MKVLKNKKKNNFFLINYSDKNYSQSQEINSKSAISIGGFQKVYSYTPKDIDDVFFKKNFKILNETKGNGFWLWKPYFIKKTLEKLKYGDYLFYCDSGSFFIESIDELFKSIDKSEDLIVFELSFMEKFYTKRDTFINLDCDFVNYYDSKQILAGFSLWKKSEFTLNFIEEWLFYCQDARNITDLENKSGLPNYEGFISHRHDQSVFSLLTKKNKIKPYRDPSQFGNTLKKNYPNSKYGQLIELTRKRNVLKKSKTYILKKMLKNKVKIILHFLKFTNN